MCYSESTLNDIALGNFLSMFDEENPDIFNPSRTTGGEKKADKLGRPFGYFPKNIDFETRPGLSGCIRKLAHLFFPLYIPEEFRTPEQQEQLSNMVESLKKNGGVDMINFIQDLLKEAEVSDPKKWPANDKAEKQKVYALAGSKKEPTSYSKLSSSKRSRSRQNANHQSSHVSVEPMQRLQESDVQGSDGEEEDGEEDRAQKKARMDHA